MEADAQPARHAARAARSRAAHRPAAAPNLPDRSHFARRAARPGARTAPDRRRRRSPGGSWQARRRSRTRNRARRAAHRPRVSPARLHRVHEVDRGIGEHLPHQRHFGRRRAVEVAHAAVPQRLQHGRIRVALDGIHRRRRGSRPRKRRRRRRQLGAQAVSAAPPGAAWRRGHRRRADGGRRARSAAQRSVMAQAPSRRQRRKTSRAAEGRAQRARRFEVALRPGSARPTDLDCPVRVLVRRKSPDVQQT